MILYTVYYALLDIDGVNRRGVSSNLAQEAKWLFDTTVAATFFPDCDCACDTPHPMGFYRTARPKLSRETKISGANGDREKFIFPVQLTTLATLPG